MEKHCCYINNNGDRKICPKCFIKHWWTWVVSQNISYVGKKSKFLAHHHIIIIINIKDRTLWSVPSPELELLAPTLLRSSNCSPSLWSVLVWFLRDSVLWHSLQVWKPVPSVFIYFVQYACKSVVRGVCSHLFCGQKGCSLPEVSVTSFLPLQFFVFVRLLESNY